MLFSEKGFDGVGADDIGKAAGVSGAAIYRYFNSKDEVLSISSDAVIHPLLTGLGEPLPCLKATAGGSDRWALIIEKAGTGARATP